MNDGGSGIHKQKQPQCGQEAQAAADIKIQEPYFSSNLKLTQQNPGDQKTTENKENINADKTARNNISHAVNSENGQYGQRPKTIKLGYVRKW